MSKQHRLPALLLALLLVLSACGQSEGEADDSAGTAVAVEVETVQPTTIQRTMQGASKVTGSSEIAVIPRVAGEVKSVNVRVGDTVEKGDVLFVLDDQDVARQVEQAQAAYQTAQSALTAAQATYDATVGGNAENTIQQLEAAVSAAQINYDTAVTNLQRTEELYQLGTVSQVEVENARVNVELLRQQLESAQESLRLTQESILAGNEKQAAAGVAQAEASVTQAQVALDQARSALDDVTVTAPVSGTISMSQVDEGATVGQSAVMTIVSMDSVQLTVSVTDREINSVQAGDTAYVTVTALSDEPLEGTVTSVAQAADQTMLYPVEVTLSNADGQLKPGMFATVQLVVERHEQALTVPIGAVMERNGENYVFVVGEDGLAHKTVVEIGMADESRREILSGLTAGDQVIVTGQSYLADGDEVEVVKEETET